MKGRAEANTRAGSGKRADWESVVKTVFAEAGNPASASVHVHSLLPASVSTTSFTRLKVCVITTC